MAVFGERKERTCWLRAKLAARGGLNPRPEEAVGGVGDSSLEGEARFSDVRSGATVARRN